MTAVAADQNVTIKRTLKLGDAVVVLCRDHVPHPTDATIIALTNEPGKTVGVMFDEPVGRHTCDGRCPDKHGLWVRPDQVRTVEEYAAMLDHLKERAKNEPAGSSEFKELEVAYSASGRIVGQRLK